MSRVIDHLVDQIIQSGPLGDAHEWVTNMRHPPGRTPSAISERLAAIISKLNNEEAELLCRSFADTATYCLIMLLSNDFGRSGLHAAFSFDGETIDTLDNELDWWGAYRRRVDPNGLLVDNEVSGGNS